MGVERPNASEHLVTVHSSVLRDAEHTLGNLFQRLYHATRLNRDGLGPHAERLTTALEDLEAVVELVFDYVSPVDLELRPIPAVRIAESLGSQVTDRTKGEVLLGECPAVSVSADSRRLRRCFQLMGRACEQDWAAADRVCISVSHDAVAELAQFVVSWTTASGNGGSRADSLLWAVAARLIELHGGVLQQTPSAAENTCLIVLPTAKDDDARI
jgi:hypothetical protein